MADPQQLVGRQLDQFQIQEHIARGGMADVYLAYDLDLQRRVALKVMLPLLAIDDQFVARFRREAQTAARLEHPNIVRVYAIGSTHAGQPYIAMQFVDGGDLGQVLKAARDRGQRLTAVQALRYLRPMAAALTTAHAASVIHRDLKPSNILLRPDGTPIMVDLGIAAVQTGAKLTNTGTLIGTPAYMSPEQARGAPVDGRSDLYSFGVILYELLSGHRPFEADDPLAILHKHVYEEPVPIQQLRPDISPQTAQLVHRCLQKEPDQRPATAVDLVRDIDATLRIEGERPDRSTGDFAPFPSRTDSVQPPRKNKWRWAGVGAMMLVVAVGLFLASRPLTITGSGIVTAVSPTVAAELETAGESGITSALPPTVVAEDEFASQPLGDELRTDGTGNEATPIVTALLKPTDTYPPPTDTPPATDTPPPTDTALPPTATAVLIETLAIGSSVNNRNIEAVRFGNGANVVIFVGGLHAGAAPNTVALAERAIAHFTSNVAAVPANVTLVIIPNASPDSPLAPGELDGRLNANRVDLNRNWDCRWVKDAKWQNRVIPGSGGSAPFSEPETQALVNFITGQNSVAVIFWEARATNGLASPGFCEGRTLVSGPLVTTYGQAAGYRIGDFEDLTNQELNGDATNWLDQQGIPAIAVLLPDYETVDWASNLSAILAVLKSYDN